MHPAYINPIVFVALAIVVAGCVFSLWKGGPAERIGGAVVLANTVSVLLMDVFLPSGSAAIPELVVDGLTAVGLLGVVLVYGSLWLGGAMLLYAAQFTLHAFYFVTERAPDHLHAVINNLDFSGIVLCLVVGAAVAWRKRVRSAAAAA
jgi:hypothetical protein